MYFGETRRKEILVIFNILDSRVRGGSVLPLILHILDSRVPGDKVLPIILNILDSRVPWWYSASFHIKYFRFKGA